MSLSTLKAKVNQLISKAKYGKCFNDICTNTPTDFVVPDGIKDISQTMFGTLPFIQSLSGKDLKTLDGVYFAAPDLLINVNLPSIESLSNNIFNGFNNLLEVYTPSVSSIGGNAFLNSPNITALTVGTLTETTTSSFKPCEDDSGLFTEIWIGEGTKADLYWQYSTKYTQECLHQAIEHLADLTGQEAKTLSVGSTNIAKIDEAHVQMLDNKNWILE